MTFMSIPVIYGGILDHTVEYSDNIYYPAISSNQWLLLFHLAIVTLPVSSCSSDIKFRFWKADQHFICATLEAEASYMLT